MDPRSYRRFAALCGLVFLFVLSSCVDGTSPAGVAPAGTAAVALNATFPDGTTPEQIGTITRVRVTVKRVSDDSVIGSFTTDVDPNQTVWTIQIDVEIPPGNPPVYLVTELISVLNGVETVEFSGITSQFKLTGTGAAPVQEVSVVQGPLTNNFVTSVTLQPAGPVTEGDGAQLQAEFVLSRPGAATPLWTTTDASVASVTSGGFLQAHAPGTIDVIVTAGRQSDRTTVLVLARPIGLAFVAQPGTVEVGGRLQPAPSVEVVDARGDRVVEFAGPVQLELQDRSPASLAAAAEAAPGSVAAPQAAPLNGTTTVNAVNGLATFEDLVVPEGGLFRLLATSQGLNPATSGDFRVALLVADLAVSKQVDRPAGVLAGDQVTFLVSVRNNGPAAATGVVVSDALPTGLSLVSSTATHGAYAATTGLWAVGALANGEVATLTLVVKIANDTGGRSLTNVATARTLSEQTDDPSNNEASATVDVGRRVADLQIKKIASASEVRETESVVYTITVLNRGPDRADRISVADHLPRGLELISARPEVGRFNANLGVWEIDRLEAGAQARLFLEAVVREGHAGEAIVNTATAAELAHQVDDPSNNSSSATILARPVARTPENHTFTTAGNTLLIGGDVGELGGPDLAPAMEFNFAAAQAHSLLKNTPSLTVTNTELIVTAEEGLAQVGASGAFAYLPPPRFQGEDSFLYTTNNGSATVTIDVLHMVWYVDNRGIGECLGECGAPAPAQVGLTGFGLAAAEGGPIGVGLSVFPFENLWDAENASGPGDAIFVYRGDGSDDNQNFGINLQEDQFLIGEGSGLDVPGVGSLLPPGLPPKISNQCGVAVTLADGAEVMGILIEETSSGAIFASNVDGGFVRNVEISNPGGHAISLFNTIGTFEFHDVTITSSDGAGFRVDNGDPTVNFDGSISGSTGFVIDIYNTIGGSASFTGSFQSSGGGAGGVSLNNADGDVFVQNLNVMSGSGQGVDIWNSDGTFTFDNLEIDGVLSDAFKVDAGSPTVIANIGPGGVNQVANDAVVIENTTGGSVTFNGNPISDTDNRGIFLDNNAGSVTFNNDVDVLDPSGGAAPAMVAASGFRTPEGMAAVIAASGTVLITNGSGPVTFESLDVTSLDGMTGVVVSNHSGLVTTLKGNINSSGGAALKVNDSSGNLTFASVTVANSSVGGISLGNNTGTFTFNDVDIAFSDGVGLEIDDSGTVNVFGPTNTVTTIGTSGSRQALYVNDTNIDMAFQSVTCDTCSTGIFLEEAVGPLLIDGGAINGTTANGVDIDGGNGDFRFDGTIFNENGNSVTVIARGAGTIQFGGNIEDSGSGINLQNNSGTFRFDGGLNLHTGTSTSFNASSTGTLDVTGTNTINNTSGVGIDISNTTIGASGVTFKSVSCDGCPAGIDLNGVSGGTFAVTGTGGGGSGGLIENTPSPHPAIRVQNSSDVSISSVDIQNTGGSGVLSVDSQDLTFEGLDVDGSTLTGISLSNSSGTLTLTNNTIHNSGWANVSVLNDMGTATLLFTNNTVTDGSGSWPGFEIRPTGTANFTGTISGGSIMRHGGSGVTMDAEDGSVTDLTVTGVTFDDNGGAVILILDGSGTSDFALSDNTATSSTSNAFEVSNRNASTSSFTGSITGNVIDGVSSGSGVLVLGFGPASGTVLVSGNAISDIPSGDGVVGQLGLFSSGALGVHNLTVADNTIDFAGVGSGTGIRVSSYESFAVCTSISGNDVTASNGGAGTGISLRQFDTSALQVDGLGAGTTDTETVRLELVGQNPLGGPVFISLDSPPATFDPAPAGGCPLP